jgi:outer membrane protein assembly factor BamB
MSQNASDSMVVVGVDGGCAGIDRATGEVRWRTGTAGGGNGVVELAVTPRLVFAHASNAKLTAIDRATGRVQWSAEAKASTRGSILVDGDEVFFGEVGHVTCYALDGRLLWHRDLQSRDHVSIGFPGNVRQADAR